MLYYHWHEKMNNPPYAYLLVVSLSFVCYWNSLECDLVHDDIFAIKENQDLRADTPWLSLFKNDFWGKSMADNTSHKSFRPLTVATFRLNYSFHGLNPFGYHFVNALLHTIVSVLFLHFCKWSVFNDQKTSIFTAVMFTVHPIHTEAVTGVVGRADVLACLMFLISLQIYSRALEVDDSSLPINNNLISKQAALHSNIPLLAVVGLSSVGMLCKEQGITIIGVCIFLEIARRREDIKNFIFKRLEFCDIERSSRALLRITILIISAMFLMVFRLYLMKGQLPAFSEEDNPASFSKSITTRFMTYCYLCAFNLQLLLIPSCLSYDWQVGSIPLVESFTDIRNLQTAVTFITLAALSVRALAGKTHSKNSQNVLLLALALMVVPFLPASNLFFRVGFVVAERILYIPSLGYCILMGHGFRIMLSQLDEDTVVRKCEAVNGASHKRETMPKEFRKSSYVLVLAASSCVLMSALMLRTIDRNAIWKNRETLFRSGIEILPHNAKAHYNYANLMKDTGKTDEAIQHYKTAIRLYPKHASSHNNLATLLGMSKEAEYHLKQTLVHNPYHYKAMYNLASFYKEKHRNKEAKMLLERCLSIKPNYYEAVQILADVLHDLGETRRAVELFYNASLGCTDANFFNNYGYFLGNIGKWDLSLRAYERSIEIDPKHRVSLVNYGRQLKIMERHQEAEVAYRRALSIKRDPSTLHLLAVLLYQTGRLKECELAFSEALKYEPRNEDYIRNHAIAVFEQEQKDDAVYLLREALKILPNSSSIVKLLVNFLMNISKPSEALDAVSIGLRSNPDDYELHFMRANAFKELKNLDLALESYKDVVKLNPKHFSSLQNIGVIYHIKGYSVEAKHFYDKALEIEPDNNLLKDNIAKLVRTMRKRSDKAIKSSANMA